MSLILTTTDSINAVTGGTTNIVGVTKVGELIVIPVGTAAGTTYNIQKSVDGINFIDFDNDPTIGLSSVDIEEGSTIRADYSGVPFYQIIVAAGGTGSVQFQFFQK
jgi:hypothetical protein